MFCPKCKSEYENGYTVCSDYNVDLVDELPKPIIREKSLSNRYAFFVITDLLLGIIGGIFIFVALGIMLTNGQPGPYRAGSDTVWLGIIGVYLIFMLYFNVHGTILYCEMAGTKFFSVKGIFRFVLTLLGLFICILIGLFVIGQALF